MRIYCKPQRKGWWALPSKSRQGPKRLENARTEVKVPEKNSEKSGKLRVGVCVSAAMPKAKKTRKFGAVKRMINKNDPRL